MLYWSKLQNKLEMKNWREDMQTILLRSWGIKGSTEVGKSVGQKKFFKCQFWLLHFHFKIRENRTCLDADRKQVEATRGRERQYRDNQFPMGVGGPGIQNTWDRLGFLRLE